MLKKSHRRKDEIALQITSMADVFTILLVFLLKSSSISITEIAPLQDMTLPESAGGAKIIESTKLEVSSNHILIDDHEVVLLKEYAISSADLDDRGAIKPLVYAITKTRKPSSTAAAGLLVLLADRDTPYSTLRSVLSTVAGAGFANLKLVVVEPDNE